MAEVYTADKILEVIHMLAKHQGYYMRVYNDLCFLRQADPDTYAKRMEELESQGFTCPCDVVLFFET